MSAEATHHCENLGKVVTYIAYNLGVGIFIGVVRTLIAVAYIAKHAFFAQTYAEAQKSQGEGGFFSQLASKMKNEVVQTSCEVRQEAWYGELVRGLSEMFVIGAPYYTYQDNFSKEHQVSVFGLKELAQLIQDEANADDAMKLFFGKAYNPVF